MQLRTVPLSPTTQKNSRPLTEQRDRPLHLSSTLLAISFPPRSATVFRPSPVQQPHFHLATRGAAMFSLSPTQKNGRPLTEQRDRPLHLSSTLLA